MIVMGSKYKRHSEYFAMDQEKFFGKKNIFFNAAVFSEDTYSFFDMIIWCSWNQTIHVWFRFVSICCCLHTDDTEYQYAVGMQTQLLSWLLLLL